MPPLPFDKLCNIHEAGESDPVDGGENVPCAIWQQEGGDTNDRGTKYDHRAQLPLSAAPLLIRVGNRRLKVDGVTYTVVSAVKHDFLPHVAVRLAELRAGG